MRLWELPTFSERGELSAVHDARALTAGSAAGLLVSGDKHGAVKVCRRTHLGNGNATATAHVVPERTFQLQGCSCPGLKDYLAETHAVTVAVLRLHTPLNPLSQRLFHEICVISSS